MTLKLEEIGPQHQDRLIAASIASKALHADWVTCPKTAEEFCKALGKYESDSAIGFLALDQNDNLVAWISLSEIVRGGFQSAYMGYCVFKPFDGQGLMSKAMKLVIARAFGEIGLHRLEANIQPENTNSIGLVESLGFRREGLSLRYLRVAGEWRDHQRYAITTEEFEL
jgi:[ribosomal protein S5]-alanine N-acetyltransferase